MLKTYSLYIDADPVEKMPDTYYDDMMFGLLYLIRVRNWKRGALVIEHDRDTGEDRVFYRYDGDVEAFKEWYYNEEEKHKVKTL